MAVDKKNEKLVRDRLVFMDESIDSMDDVTDIQENVFKQLSIMLIKDLDLDKEGNIKRTRKNQKAAQRMNKIRPLILTDGYKAMVGKFISSFNTVKSMSDEQIKEV
tara:strand:- start:559 stop:876 length:318 start_codon:yes stop_codon:yes gene_type:complete